MSKNTIYTSIVTSAILLILTAASHDIASTGAPASSTGAPNEETCYTSGCHDDVGLNSGSGILSLEIDQNPIKYVAGQTYSITVSITRENIERFGFEILALDDNEENTGEFLITDSDRTQIISGSLTNESRKYVTYKYAGTKAVSTGLGEWSFDWRAPENYYGNITFYVAGVAANNDATDSGDEVYTESVTLSAYPNAISSPKETISNLILKYNNNILEIQYNFNEPQQISVDLINLNGQIINLSNQRRIDGISNEFYDLSTNIASGLYVVSVKGSQNLLSRKILIN
ncbi:MAG: hypothetical protein COC01_05125 [Bacteroidetes bacterium]|nr:MAG: hypothetical protein COC01_05125 [Bacteroidota bacterium]